MVTTVRMSTLDEKHPGVDHHDEDQAVDTAVHIAHETEDKKISPWTGSMLRLYLVLAVAYLCGYVLVWVEYALLRVTSTANTCR